MLLRFCADAGSTPAALWTGSVSDSAWPGASHWITGPGPDVSQALFLDLSESLHKDIRELARMRVLGVDPRL